MQRHPAVAIATIALCLLSACQAGRPAGPSAAPASTAARPTSSPVRSATIASTPAADPTTAGNPGGLTDAELVGQLFYGYVYGSSATSATALQRQANLALYGAPTGAAVIRRWHLGGIILLDHNTLDPARDQLSTGNVDSASQVTGLTRGLQQAARDDSGVPLLIGTDQEGGQVQRITDGVTQRPSELALADAGTASLSCGYYTLGRQLGRLGVNQDFAPVADVVRTATGVIGDRSFGPDPALDTADVHAAVVGLQAAGVAATLKHWPGHGSTSTDSHQQLAVITEPKSQWLAVDRPPFQASAAIVDSIMVGHLALPAIDPTGRPATLSNTLINGALRQGLGFHGLVITDSLWMAPVRRSGTAGQVAEQAVAAGADMLLMSPDVPSAATAMLARLRTDSPFRVQVRTAVRTILAVKAKLGTTGSLAGCAGG